MGQTLTNGIYLPSEGERNCYAGLAANWNAVDTLKGSYSAHAINVEIHVTTAEKTLWNTVSDKANDADVVHKAGNESIDGKTFLTSSYFYNTEEGATTPTLYIRSNKAVIGDSTGTNSDNSRISFLDKNNQILNYIQFRKVSNGSSDITFYVSSKDANDASISSSITFFKAKDGSSVFRATVDNDVALGNSSYKFKDVRSYQINGINPGALFLPQDRSNRVDISAYFTATASGDTNRLTAPDDGFIYLALTDVLLAHCFSQTSNNLTHYGQTFGRGASGLLYIMFPIRKNDNFVCQWYTTATAVTVNNAYFIPCKGNV